MPGGTWNHSIHYFPLILRVAGQRLRSSALDVGSGDGMLAAALASGIPSVVGIDVSAEQVAIASKRYADAAGLRFIEGDVLTTDLAGEPFDLVACSATLHHLQLQSALLRLRGLTAPGGTLIVIGLTVEKSGLDWLVSALGVIPNRIARLRRGWHEHGAPTTNPQETLAAVRGLAEQLLPGSVIRRRLYWRYSLVWERPAG